MNIEYTFEWKEHGKWFRSVNTRESIKEIKEVMETIIGSSKYKIIKITPKEEIVDEN